MPQGGVRRRDVGSTPSWSGAHRRIMLGRAGQAQAPPATYHRAHGVRYFHGCDSLGHDMRQGVNRCKKGAASALAALRSIRADSLFPHQGEQIWPWARENRVELSCTRPTRPGRNRSRLTSGSCGSSPSPAPTTATTRCRSAPCAPTYAGEHRWPPSQQAGSPTLRACPHLRRKEHPPERPNGFRHSSRGLLDDLRTLSVGFSKSAR